ncbi:MAG: alcohol dehydrogenase catalytic domain-containing protein [Chloroflexi bacterium]|nr:alcohol dehydrogenase catalytic domain-containing protein [Chloroflexota bacterium]
MTTLARDATRGDSEPPAELPQTMRAGVLVAPRALELRQFDLPRPAPGQVLVRVHATALCTWEQRTYAGIQAIKTPFVGGHETAGVVAAIGEGVLSVRVGDHVALGPVACDECHYCRRGFPARCETNLGRFALDGVWGPWGLAEFKLVPSRAAFRVPDDLPFAEASLCEPISCVVHSVRALQPELGDDVVIIGAGPMGLLNLLVLKRRGVRAIVCELDAGRRDKARMLGADTVLDPHDGDFVEQVSTLTEGRGADAVVAAVGSAQADALAFDMVGKTGKVVLFASAHPSPKLSVDHNLIHKNEVDVLGVEGKTVQDFLIAVRLVSHGLVDVRPLIDQLVPLGDLERAFELALRPDTYRIIVTP